MEKLVLTPIPLTDLVGEIARAVRAEMDATPKAGTAAPEELLTRMEAAELLGITLPTLRDYTNRGLVTGYRIGTRVRYKRSEVIDGLQAIRTSRNHRK